MGMSEGEAYYTSVVLDEHEPLLSYSHEKSKCVPSVYQRKEPSLQTANYEFWSPRHCEISSETL